MHPTDLFTWIGAVITVVCALAFAFQKYLARNDDFWEKRGIRYIPRKNVFAALRYIKNEGFHGMLLKDRKQCGRIYGSFIGSDPVLFVADADLLRDILVKDFHIFHYRRDMEMGDPVTDKIVNFLKGEDWKRVRTVITPAFTSRRMRQMSSIISRCSKAAIDTLEKNSETGDAVDFRHLFGAFTMDVIAASAFGTKIDPYSDPNDIFIQQAKNTFLELSNWRILLFLILPMWMFRYLPFTIFGSGTFFKQVVTEVIRKRKQEKKRYKDVLQILIDAVHEQEQAEHLDLNVDEEDRYGSIINKGLQTQLKYKTLSQNELLAQCILFFFVGYETSASVLTFMAYSIATNPEWQEKLIAEVDEGFTIHSEMSYDSVRGMKVLDAVISETLRMYPPILVSERTASEDYKLGDTGIIVEKGMNIQFPIYALHFDSKYFEEPEKFDPNRFLDSSKSTFPQYAYLPFGAGPRNCLGMRFALLEIKLCITNLLRHYRFKIHSSTKVSPEIKKGHQFFTVTEMPLAVEKRTDVK